MVAVTHMEAGGAYPHNLEDITTFAEKLYDLYLQELIETAFVIITGGSGMFVIPVFGLLAGVGVMFLQSFQHHGAF